MQPGQPSRTALGAAGLRAAHQVLDGAAIFADPLALRILGADADDLVREAEAEADPFRHRLRWFIAIRSRIAEDALAAAIKRGVRQLVVLGAGLDTTAYRAPHSQELRIFEVDHPATQTWKRERLAKADIALPASLTFVPVDFERETVADGLAAAGFDSTQQTFFTWLGVVPYLTDEAIFSTLGFIAGLLGGAHVVFDYVNPAASVTEPARRAAHEALVARVAAAGESIRTHFDSAALHVRLKALGFREVEDLGWAEVSARFFPGRPVSSGGGAHVLRAATISP
ncbi:MAG TPA: SAM-dependent methyltransferase [Bradyrhizobium sp.]|jgi:methyltransferase (TIGR00027 family)|nr:SAM-dependent methyltransferase [Bradyrhizobium sp.]